MLMGNAARGRELRRPNRRGKISPSRNRARPSGSEGWLDLQGGGIELDVRGRCLDVEVADVQRVVFDKLAPRLDLVAHQQPEKLVRIDRVINTNL